MVNLKIKAKQQILEWMLKQNIRAIEDVGVVMAKYYMYPDEIASLVKKGGRPSWLGKNG